MSKKNNNLRDTGPIDVAKIQETIKTKEYQAIPFAPETITITITKEDAGFLDQEARALNLNFEDTAAYVLHRGIHLLKQLRSFRSARKHKEITERLKKAARWEWK